MVKRLPAHCPDSLKTQLERPLLFDPSGLADAVAEVIELRSANASTAHDVQLLNPRRIQQECCRRKPGALSTGSGCPGEAAPTHFLPPAGRC